MPSGLALPSPSLGGHASLSSSPFRHGVSSSPPHSPRMVRLLLPPPLGPKPRKILRFPLCPASHWLPVSLFTNQNQLGTGSQKLCAACLVQRVFGGNIISIDSVSSYKSEPKVENVTLRNSSYAGIGPNTWLGLPSSLCLLPFWYKYTSSQN